MRQDFCEQQTGGRCAEIDRFYYLVSETVVSTYGYNTPHTGHKTGASTWISRNTVIFGPRKAQKARKKGVEETNGGLESTGGAPYRTQYSRVSTHLSRASNRGAQDEAALRGDRSARRHQSMDSR